jgi:hypothetical protein
MNSAARVFLEEKNWDSFLKCLSLMEREILGTLQNRSMSPTAIARSLLSPSRVNAISSVCSRLASKGVLKSEKAEYSVSDPELSQFLALQDFTLSLEDVMSHIENTVYRETVGLFEALEHAGKTHGNGHHAAQKLATTAKEMVKDRWREGPSSP